MCMSILLNSMARNSNNNERKLDIYSMVKKTLWSTMLIVAFVLAECLMSKG